MLGALEVVRAAYCAIVKLTLHYIVTMEDDTSYGELGHVPPGATPI